MTRGILLYCERFLVFIERDFVKYLLYIVLFTFPCLGMRHNSPIDDDITERGTHPELHCFRLLEKISWTEDQVSHLKMYGTKKECDEMMQYLQDKLIRLHAKLIAHEND